MPDREFTFIVRASEGHPMEWLPATYSEEELAYMRACIRRVEVMPPGPERTALLNEMLVTHELKALLGARALSPSEEEELRQRSPAPWDGPVTSPDGKVKVVLPPWAQAVVKRAAKQRYARRRRAHSKQRYGQREDAWTPEKEVAALGGEFATGLVIGREWRDSKLPDYHGDLGPGVQVRHTLHANGHLMLHPDDKDDHAFFLASGPFPTYVVHGWLYGSEAREAGTWKELQRGRPATCVESGLLHRVAEWRGGSTEERSSVA